VARATALLLSVLVVGSFCVGCGCGEITQQDQYDKAKQLEKQGEKDPRDGGIEK